MQVHYLDIILFAQLDNTAGIGSSQLKSSGELLISHFLLFHTSPKKSGLPCPVSVNLPADVACQGDKRQYLGDGHDPNPHKILVVIHFFSLT